MRFKDIFTGAPRYLLAVLAVLTVVSIAYEFWWDGCRFPGG
jgi:hypothetical protein